MGKRCLTTLPLVVLATACVVLGQIQQVYGLELEGKPEIGTCAWYGQCGTCQSTGMPCNCPYSGAPKVMKDPEGLKLLAELCPMFLNDSTTGETVTCCDTNQLSSLSQSISVPKQMLQRCPSCFDNFMHFYCYLTCGTNQSQFMSVNKTEQPDPKKPAHITELNFVVSNAFAGGLFNSCRDVQMPSGNQKAINTLCGTSQCDPLTWLQFMGDPGKDKFAPFMINFNISDEDVTYDNSTLSPLNKTIEPCSSGCSCQDCRESCGAPPNPYKHPSPWTIFGIDAMYIIMGGIFGAFVIIFGTWEIWRHVICSTAGEPQSVARPTDQVMVNGYATGKKKDVYLTPKDVGCCHRIGACLERKLENGFRNWGYFCARHPYIVLGFAAVLCIALSSGIAMFQVITDPVELWSSPDSRARLEKNYFDEHFTPFYRTEMLIITVNDGKQWEHENIGSSGTYTLFGPALRQDILSQVLELQNRIEAIEVFDPELNMNVTMKDICFKPLFPDNDECTIMSVPNYFQNNLTRLENYTLEPDFQMWKTYDYTVHLQYCFRDPANPKDPYGPNYPCMGKFGGPVNPWTALGGYPDNNFENATALVVTMTMNNFKNETFQKMALAWEKGFLDLIKNYENPNITISYSSERSIEDEINRESNSDIKTVLVSYLIMFAYVAFSLGQYRSCGPSIMVRSKIFLGLAGVIIVMLSVTSAIGLYSFMKVPATLIIIEVVPFLVLAVGVDNIFILVQTYQRFRNDQVPVEEQISRAVGRVGPSMLLTSLSESLAFFLGALTSMPAVKVFSLYAAMAVLFDFLLQISVFVGLLALDARREKASRSECCIEVQKQEEIGCGLEEGGLLFTFFKKFYSKFLLSSYVRPVVIIVFVGFLCVGAAVTNKVELGLDQKLSMPQDSYMLKYFESMAKYLSVGPPMYMVVKEGHNYTDLEGQNKICGSKGCPEFSMLGQLYEATLQPNYSRIALPASSWLDDYFDWISPGGHPPCCRENTIFGNFCASTVVEPNHCEACHVTEQDGRPVREDFLKYLPWYLEDNPGLKCAKGGHAAYGSAVELLHDKTQVGASYFMTYHTVLKTSEDYIAALWYARQMADNITKLLNHWPGQNTSSWTNISDSHNLEAVFPYSVFYVYYEQYLTIVMDSIFNLSLSCSAIFVMSFILLGFDLWSAFMIIITIGFIMNSMFALMFFWDITLNAVSLVNLVMTVGISVEFCSHIARAFAVSIEENRVERAKDALANMGSSVLSGITLTKLGGIVILAFSKSQLFQVFYFRMYLGMVVFGAAHGLIFLPVLLSYVGPPINKAKLFQAQQMKMIMEDSRDGSIDDDDRRPIIAPANDLPPPYTEHYPSMAQS